MSAMSKWGRPLPLFWARSVTPVSTGRAPPGSRPAKSRRTPARSSIVPSIDDPGQHRLAPAETLARQIDRIRAPFGLELDPARIDSRRFELDGRAVGRAGPEPQRHRLARPRPQRLGDVDLAR